MGSFSKVVVFSACLVLSLAQDYEYSINQDKVSFRNNPSNSPSQFQRQPTLQSNNFQRAQPLQSAQLSKYQSIPQVINQQSSQPQQTSFSHNQFNGQAHESATESHFQSAPAPVRFQNKADASFRPAGASTYVPNTQSFQGQQNQNAFSQPPVQNAPSFSEESEFAPAPVQQFVRAPQKVQQASFEQTPVRRPAKVRPAASVAPLSSVPAAQSADDLAIIQEQNANAKYAFSSNVQNGIHDNSLQRQEVRDGLALKGMYAYSDGFFKRTVQYEADENGYRIVNESAEPIGEGPQLNLDGRAQVATDIDGTSHGYSITADDIIGLRKQKQPFRIVA